MHFFGGIMKHYLYFDYGFSSNSDRRIELIKKAGFAGVFLFYKTELEEDIKKIKNANLDIETIHLPFKSCNSLWLDNEEGENYINETIEGIFMASRNNIPTVVFHVSSKDNPPAFNEIGLNRIKKVIEICEKEKINFALENLRRLDYIDYLFANIKSDYLKFCFDSGHANAFTKNIASFPFNKYQDKLICVHLHDNFGDHDSHLIPGMGIIDFEKLARKLVKINYMGPLTSEAIIKDETLDEFDSLVKIKKSLELIEKFMK